MSSRPSAQSSMDQCIQMCMMCYRVCLETMVYCLQIGGKHAEAGHITLLMDCAEICRTSADFMIRNSQLHAVTCEACAEVCERCAEHCAGFGGDAQMEACADACRRCSMSCREMSAGQA